MTEFTSIFPVQGLQNYSMTEAVLGVERAWISHWVGLGFQSWLGFRCVSASNSLHLSSLSGPERVGDTGASFRLRCSFMHSDLATSGFQLGLTVFRPVSRPLRSKSKVSLNNNKKMETSSLVSYFKQKW